MAGVAAAASATVGAMQVLVNMDAALLVITAESEAPQRPEMRIPKRSVRAQIGLPPDDQSPGVLRGERVCSVDCTRS